MSHSLSSESAFCSPLGKALAHSQSVDIQRRLFATLFTTRREAVVVPHALVNVGTRIWSDAYFVSLLVAVVFSGCCIFDSRMGRYTQRKAINHNRYSSESSGIRWIQKVRWFTYKRSNLVVRVVWKRNIKQSVPEDNLRPKTAGTHPVAEFFFRGREKQERRRINKRLISPKFWWIVQVSCI